VGLLDAGHIRFFTRSSAESLIGSAGFRVESWHMATSLPHASPLTRRLIDLSARLPQRLRRRLAKLIAVQFIFVARAL
jgi:hypothetical protein